MVNWIEFRFLSWELSLKDFAEMEGRCVQAGATGDPMIQIVEEASEKASGKGLGDQLMAVLALQD